MFAAEDTTNWRSIKLLRANVMTWTISAMLPLPILVATDPASSVEVSCVYLGLGCGWLAMEIYRSGGLPTSVEAWVQKMLAICIGAATNASAFVVFGSLAGVQTSFPFALMATLSAAAAVGLVPWLLRRVSHPYMAIVLGSVLLLAAKLAACVVARIRYGPNYVEEGYVAGDWHTAKLMISLFWIFSILLSLTLLTAEYLACKQRADGITSL